jgi:SAM-dependent methyltransferase
MGCGRSRQPVSCGRSTGWSSVDHCVAAPLAAWLRPHLEAADGRRVLDLGGDARCDASCGATGSIRVSRPLMVAGCGVAEVATAAEAAFDIVVCLHLLERVADPAALVRELRRAVRPGGVVLVAAPGTGAYEADPSELWRWTRDGLELLFRANGPWTSLRVTAAQGTAATLMMLLAHTLDATGGAGLSRLLLRRPLVTLLNVAGEALDRALPRLRRPVPGSLTASFHVEAVA